MGNRLVMNSLCLPDTVGWRLASARLFVFLSAFPLADNLPAIAFPNQHEGLGLPQFRVSV